MSDERFHVNIRLPPDQDPKPPPYTGPNSWALRADDLLSLRLNFVNLQLSTFSPGKPVLTIANPANPAFIVVVFPPQNMAEQAFWSADSRFFPVPPAPGQLPEPGGTEQPKSPAESRIANESRLAFIVPPDAGPISYNLASLLEKCSEFALSVAATAAGPPPIGLDPVLSNPGILNIHLGALKTVVATPVASATANPAALTPHASAAQLADRMVQHRAALQSRRSLTYKIATGAIAASNIPSVTVGPPPLDEPKITETAIEMPYRLIISPNQYGAWAHASTPISSPAERTELWHTRLGRRPSAAEPIDETAAAQYSWNFSAIWARDPAIKEKQAPAHDQVPFRTSLDAFDRWNIVHQSYNHPTADIVANRMMLTTLRASATPLFVSHRGALGRHLAVCAARLEPRVALMSRRTMVVEAEQEPGYWVGGDP